MVIIREDPEKGFWLTCLCLNSIFACHIITSFPFLSLFKCINAMPKEAQEISSKLSDEVREVCFQELLMFLERWESSHIITSQTITVSAQIVRLSSQIKECCLFVWRYSSEQTEILGKKAKMDKPETIHFFKTLKTCKELKWVFFCFVKIFINLR